MLPTLLIEELKSIPGFDLAAYLRVLEQPPTRALRLNLCKGDPKEALKRVQEELGKDALRPLGYVEEGFYLTTEQSVGTLPLHHAGAYYMQEPSAMCPVACLPLKKGMRVLDLCASPGGKSTQIANRIGQEGLLVSNEINHSRCGILAGNIERMGIRNAIVTNTDAQTLAKHFPAFFDAVVVDAPCSGEGMLRKMPEAREDWGADSPVVCKERQLDILSHAAKTLKGGGYLLYSTCTYSMKENEEVVTEFLMTHPDFSVTPVPKEIEKVTLPGIEIAPIPLFSTRRFYPYFAEGEGQYMALLQKEEGDTFAQKSEKKSKKESGKKPTLSAIEEKKVVEGFLCDCLSLPPKQAPIPFKAGYTLPPMALSQAELENFPLPMEYIYAFGVKIGEVRKSRVVPYHHFFTAYGDDFKTKLPISSQDPRIYSYLRGDVISADTKNGWGVIFVDGYPLGGIKVTDGMAKNHYPTGLRNKI